MQRVLRVIHEAQGDELLGLRQHPLEVRGHGVAPRFRDHRGAPERRRGRGRGDLPAVRHVPRRASPRRGEPRLPSAGARHAAAGAGFFAGVGGGASGSGSSSESRPRLRRRWPPRPPRAPAGGVGAAPLTGESAGLSDSSSMNCPESSSSPASPRSSCGSPPPPSSGTSRAGPSRPDSSTSSGNLLVRRPPRRPSNSSVANTGPGASGAAGAGAGGAAAGAAASTGAGRHGLRGEGLGLRLGLGGRRLVRPSGGGSRRGRSCSAALSGCPSP